MPTATEPTAPKAAAKPSRPPPKKDGEKQAEQGKKRTTSGSEKKQQAAAAEGQKKAGGARAGGEEKRTTSGSERKRTTSGSETKKTTSGGDKKPSERRAPRRAPIEVDEPAPEPVYVPKLPVSVPVLNTLEWASCAKVLENLLDFTASLGAALAHRRPFSSAQHLVAELNLALDGLPLTYIEGFLKRFNELALIPQGKLSKEHKCCVGLDKLTEEQKAELTPLYADYREKFGFPFVVCAREAKVAELAVMLRSHLLNDKDQELESGRREVKKIARLRLFDVVVA